MSQLRYTRPARTWTEALPIGNGFQGAMIFGDGHIQINEGTAWSGSDRSESTEPIVTPGHARAAIADARAAVAAGDYVAADAAVRRLQHRHGQAFLPFADLRIRLSATGAITDYERRLDLDTATHETTCLVGGSRIRTTAFASHPDRVLVYRIEAESPVDVRLDLTTPLRVIDTDGSYMLTIQLPSDVAPPHEATPEPVCWDPAPGASLRGAVVVGVSSGLRGVTRADLFIATATTFDGIARPPRGDEGDALDKAAATVERAMRAGADEVHKRHVGDYQALFHRVRWSPAAPARTGQPTDGQPTDERPTGERLLAANAHPDGALAADPGLAPLLFDYGRYLLISCSRPGGTPANLQGIWNDQLRPPWSSNFTTNINVEMNYWPADVANLPECLTPLIDLVEGLSRTGAETARRLYDAPGWVAHHNADIWGYSQPVGYGHNPPKWAFWPFAGVWLTTQLADHVAFGARSPVGSADGRSPDGRSPGGARSAVWPLVRSAAEFLLAWLVSFDDATVGTSPSTSPENEFYTDSGAVAGVSRSSSMDLSLAAALLRGVVALGPDDDPVVARARATLPLIPFPVHNGAGHSPGQDGLVREWWHDPVATEPDHRHQSHLWFLYPGTGAVPTELAAAASRSLDARSDDSTGWSLAWRLALRARLRQPEAVSRLLRLFFRDMTTERGPHSGGLYPNLFSAHPPFQIDANLGYVAAVAECLMHSHVAEISLLPALPREFGAGSVTGLVARPGVQVDIRWTAEGSLVTATLRPLTPEAATSHRVTYRDRSTIADLSAATVTLTPDSFA